MTRAIPLLDPVVAWVRRNERHLSTLVFVFGFVSDLLTFTLIDISVVNLLFIAYLAVAAVCTFLSHTISSRTPEKESWLRRVLSVVAPLGAQYAIGSLLSGFLIFYTKSATLLVSWPFLLLLVLIFLGNEVFRSYREHLAFQTVLFFFALYAYAIFALPLGIGALGPMIFLASTGIAAAGFALFLALLWLAGKKRFMQTFRSISLGSTAVLALIVGAYFTELIPPIPLTLQDGGVYHDLTRDPQGYTVLAEQKAAWWHLGAPVVHHLPGTPLYAYSAIFAPGAFTASVVHRWEYYDPTAKKWVTESMIAFPLSGGRKGGYRGYSEITDVHPGKWRVSIETVSGQVIGRIPFMVDSVPAEPALDLEVK